MRIIRQSGPKDSKCLSHIKNFCLMFTAFILCLYTTACTDKTGINDNIVLVVDDIEISIEQASFYAYNKQANYEVYYLANGQQLNWDEAYDKDQTPHISMEELVKTEVLNQMKETVLVSEHAKDKGITLSDEDKNEVTRLVNEFVENGKDTLIEKTGRDTAVLTTIFTRQKYIDLLYDKLGIKDDSDKQDELYEALLADSNTSLNEELWNTIAFDTAIYTANDVTPME